jgi:DNA repair exonuclease SbcCD nuclease subunit
MIKAKGMEQYVMDRLFELIPPGPDEICILAGDIGNPKHMIYDLFMEFISRSFKKAFVIPGNHEYYGRTMAETIQGMKLYFEKYTNITLLHNSCEVYERHCFVGTTLWSHVTDPTFKINDIYSIPGMNIEEYNRLNGECVEFLRGALDQENCIVITHHQPSRALIHEKYLTETMRPYNQWFACDLDELISSKKDKIKAWFYGHTHTPSETTIEGIPFLCNPIGYPGENKHFNFKKYWIYKSI